ncbi:MAG: hypothetical protein AABP62_02965 [Planctomycetota bacterium]
MPADKKSLIYLEVLTIGDKVLPIGEKKSGLVLVGLVMGGNRSVIGRDDLTIVLPTTAKKVKTILHKEQKFIIQQRSGTRGAPSSGRSLPARITKLSRARDNTAPHTTDNSTPSLTNPFAIDMLRHMKTTAESTAWPSDPAGGSIHC